MQTMKLHITNSVLFNANYDPPEEGSICFEIADDTEEIVLPEGICAIADKAFLLCKNLKKVCVPRGVQKIGKEAFASCY